MRFSFYYASFYIIIFFTILLIKRQKVDTLQKTFSFSPSFRIDVLCVNDTDCIDIETTECEISKPDWFQIYY